MIDVLIVEDDRLTRQGLISSMPWEAHGMRVAGEAANGLEALAFMKKQPVDLALCDLEMPHMDGLKLIEQASSLYPDTFFVVLTLYTDFARIQQALRLGAIDYIAKTDLDRESFSTILRRIAKRLNKERQRSGQPDAAAQMPEDLIRRWTDMEWLRREEAEKELMEELRLHSWPLSEWKRLTQSIAAAWSERCEFLGSHAAQPAFLSGRPFDEFSVWMASLQTGFRRFVLSAPFSQEVLDSLLDARAYIHHHLSEKLYAATVARHVHMSRSYFCQCFGTVFGVSFLDYVRKVRLQMARQLLTDTNQSIQSIARQTGYTDEKYFSRVFKSTYGYVPTEYRRMHRVPSKQKEDEP